MAVLAYLCFFMHLDSLTIRMWDEARNIVSALEMEENGRWLVRTFLGEADRYETKPPLLIWIQVGFIKILGYNELAVRLPSALAGLATVALLGYHLGKALNSFAAGSLAALILMASPGYVGYHATRTGDHDSLLTLLLLLSLIHYFYYLKDELPNRKHILLTFLFTALAVLTKSIVGLFAAPALLLFTLYRNKLLQTLKDPWFYLGLGIFVLLVGGYYGGRELADPGYLQSVWNMELFPRYTNNTPDYQFHEGGFWYYLRFMAEGRYPGWLFLLPLGMISAWLLRHRSQLPMLLLLAFLTIFGVISAGTKNFWYDVPLYPLMAGLIGSGMYLLGKKVQRPLLLAFLFLPFGITGFERVIDNNVHAHSRDQDPSLQSGYLLRDLDKKGIEADAYTVLTEGYFANDQVYRLFRERSGKTPLRIKHHSNDFREGELVICCRESWGAQLRARFETKVVYLNRGCRVFRMGKPKATASEKSQAN
jgi:4-amino-4-deoxy-L-arabinose transferase-like glycosyltransferase